MNAIPPTWLVAKYMPDIRRREPLNVGVILFAGGETLHRFKGQRADGTIDGRRARFAGSAENYRAWVEHWIERSQEGFREELVTRPPDQSYFLEIGGQRIFGGEETRPRDLLEELYVALVEPEPARETLNVKELSEDVFRRLRIAAVIEREFKLEVPSAEEASDSIVFDFRYDNGAVNLMKTVPLSFPDDRSWDQAHAAAWDFTQASEYRVAENQRAIGLVKGREANEDFEQQFSFLRDKADAVVDLDHEDAAANELAEILEVPGDLLNA